MSQSPYDPALMSHAPTFPAKPDVTKANYDERYEEAWLDSGEARRRRWPPAAQRAAETQDGSIWIEGGEPCKAP